MIFLNRKSTVLSVLLATTICFTNIIGSFSAYADDLDNERQAISESKAQYDLLDEQILSLNSEIANINIEIDQINTKLKDNETQIANTETEIESTKALLEQTEIEIAEKELSQAHNVQTSLIQNEANGQKTEISLLMVHAQDHLMTSMTLKSLAIELIDIHEELHKR